MGEVSFFERHRALLLAAVVPVVDILQNGVRRVFGLGGSDFFTLDIRMDAILTACVYLTTSVWQNSIDQKKIANHLAKLEPILHEMRLILSHSRLIQIIESSPPTNVIKKAINDFTLNHAYSILEHRKMELHINNEPERIKLLSKFIEHAEIEVLAYTYGDPDYM